MTDMRHEFPSSIAALARDAALAPMLGPDARLLVWDETGERILWWSPAAADLAAALTDDEGRVRPSIPARERLRALAGGIAPRAGSRLERLKFDPSGLVGLVTCACRLVTLPSGDDALLTAIVGAAPKLDLQGRAPRLPRSAEPDQGPPGEARRAPPSEAVDEGRAAPSSATDGAAESEPRRDAANRGASHGSRPHATVRFIWQADAEARFTYVSDALAGVVGAGSADVVGRSWAEILGDVIDDPSGAIAEAFRQGQTWSGRTVLWRVAGSDRAVAVDLAGMPIHDRERRLRGFRGFGLCRIEAVSASRPPEAAAPAGDPDTGEDAMRLPLGQPEEGTPATADAPETGPEAAEAAIRSRAGAIAVDAIEPGRSEPAHADPAAVGSSAARERADGPAPNPGAPFVPVNGRVGARLGEPRPVPLRATDDGGVTREPRAARPPAAQPDGSGAQSPIPRLSMAERSAFREIARALGARFEDDEPPAAGDAAPSAPAAPAGRPAGGGLDARRILERLPIGLLVLRGDTPLLANRHLLDLLDYDSLDELIDNGGLPRLFRGRAGMAQRLETEGSSPVLIATRSGESLAAEIRLAVTEWDGLPASVMVIRKVPEADASMRLRALELDLRAREARLRELSSILDTATDGIIVLDDAGRILSLNRSAEALFGYDQNEVAGEVVSVLLASESHAIALEYLEGLRSNGVASLLNDGREVLGRVRQGGTIPLFMTMGRVSEGPERKFCAVLRDITAFKKAEGELLAAKRAAEEASAQKSDFLAKISHEIRTPMSAIIGFAEVMLEERFGPIGNDRYRDYLKDIHASGGHVVSLVNDLLDLAKIEAGRMELSFSGINLNELVAAGVALMQPQAARDRIVMRTSFAAKLPPVVADERSVRQIVLNLVSNAIKFTEAGGQVIVSTALTDRGEVAFRVRDTGIGMTEQEMKAALEPFRQLATARKGGGTGLGLPLTKALVEANRGALHITSAKQEGTLAEVLFPPTRVLAG